VAVVRATRSSCPLRLGVLWSPDYEQRASGAQPVTCALRQAEMPAPARDGPADGHGGLRRET
jgi:hypothetical protein